MLTTRREWMDWNPADAGEPCAACGLTAATRSLDLCDDCWAEHRAAVEADDRDARLSLGDEWAARERDAEDDRFDIARGV